MARHVALLRGINVGTAKSITMVDLVAVFETLGATEVSTVLRSGNVVFTASSPPSAAHIEAAVLKATGVHSSVLVLPAKKLRAIADANPLIDIATDGSKSFVTFLFGPHGAIDEPDAATLAPEVMAVTADAIYQWMPEGSMQTKVPKPFWKQFTTPVTARNWNTVQKLVALSAQGRK